MTYKKALNDLKRQVEHFENGTEFSYSLPPLKVAIKALEKQIPKKPTVKKSCKVNAFTLRCPNCEAVLQSDSPCCRYCGQALDWSDTE